MLVHLNPNSDSCRILSIPRDTYADRLFTTRYTAVPGATRITNNDFSAVVKKALPEKAAA